MKNSRIILFVAALACLSSCTSRTSISGVVKDAPLQDIVIGADTLRTDASGAFRYKVKVEKGQPEFYYITRNGVRLASLLVEAGEKIYVQTDTLGVECTITGSEGSVAMNAQDDEFQKFINSFVSAPSDKEMARIYVAYYRQCLKYVMSNPFSLTTVPVLTRHIAAQAPVFSQDTDAIVFRSVADSLKKSYPDSKYTKALDAEANERQRRLNLAMAISSAKEAGFPDLALPGMTGENVSLAGVDSKVIVLHFWTPESAEQKMLNIDVLKPLYEEFHSKGFEIYSVCISANKPQWAQIVRDQQLPWINVCDGLGTASRSLPLFNVRELPTSLLIVDGEVVSEKFVSQADLRKFLVKVLK